MAASDRCMLILIFSDIQSSDGYNSVITEGPRILYILQETVMVSEFPVLINEAKALDTEVSPYLRFWQAVFYLGSRFN